MSENIGVVSHLTINGEVREIIDEQSREDIALLQYQMQYLATQINVELPLTIEPSLTTEESE